MLTPHPHVAESGSAEEGEIARTDRQAIPEGPALRREIERWFIRRGVPQFIEGYGTEQSMDRRHAAAHRLARRLVLALLVQPADGAVPLELLAVLGTMAFFGFADALTDTLRGRSRRRVPARYDLVDIGQFAVLPVVPTTSSSRTCSPCCSRRSTSCSASA